MRRMLFPIMLLVLGAAALAPRAAADMLRWQTNASYRVMTMGGAVLAIEDDTTAVNAFNHQNVAGSALLEKQNRLDLGAYYNNYHTETTQDLGGGVTQEDKLDLSDIELTHPGGEYRGVMYWLTDSLVMRAGLEGLMVTTKGSSTVTGFPAQEEQLDFYGGGGGASLAYVLENGLAFGAGLTYKMASGKPKSLDGLFGIYSGETTQYDFSASNLDWQAGLAWGLREGLGDNNQLTFGFHVGGNDERPDIGDLFYGSITPGDYTFTAKTAGTTFLGTAISEENTYTLSPMLVSGEAIFHLSDLLQAGLLFDYLSRRMDIKNRFALGSTVTTSEYKAMESGVTGISPIVKANIPAGPGLNILPGAFLTTMGSGIETNYRTNGTKFSELETGVSTIGLGLGLQAMDKQFQAGIQFETRSWSSDYTPYSATGVAGTISTTDGGMTNIRIGAEFWAVPALAIRAGFASLTNITKDAAFTAGGGITDYKYTTSRITGGLGLALGDLTADLLVLLDTYTEDPKPTPEPKASALGVYLGATLPL